MHDPSRRSRNGAAGSHHAGRVIFGGVARVCTAGCVFVILAVFIAGLMFWTDARVPRQEDFEAYDVQMSMLAVLGFFRSPCSCSRPSPSSRPSFGSPVRASRNPGPHGSPRSLRIRLGRRQHGSALRPGREYTLVQWGARVRHAGGRFLSSAHAGRGRSNLAGKKHVPPSPGTFP